MIAKLERHRALQKKNKDPTQKPNKHWEQQ